MKVLYTRPLILVSLLFVLSTNLVMAQTKTFQNILRLKMRNIGTIEQRNVVKGYYFFYLEDKIGGGQFKYRTEILDVDLNPAGAFSFTGENSIYLIDGECDGSTILLKYFNTKAQTILFYLLDDKGKLLKTWTDATDKANLTSLSYSLQNEGQIPTLYSLDGVGFVDYAVNKPSAYGYTLQFIPEIADQKGWKVKNKVTGLHESAGYLGASDDVILSVVLKRKSIFSQDGDYFITGHELATGKMLFEKKQENKQYEIQPMATSFDSLSGILRVYGLYFTKGENILKAPSLGFYMYMMDDNTGEVLIENYVSWQKDVSKFLPVEASGKLKDIGWVYFHRFYRAADGNYFAIGEQFRKAADGFGIAAAAMGNKASTIKILVQDMMVFQFDDGFNLKDIHVFDQSSNDVTMPAGAEWMASNLLALYVKSHGGFDYSFLQPDETNTRFTVGFEDYLSPKGGKSHWVFNAATYNNGKFTTDQLDLKTESSDLRVFKAKPGYIMVSEYFRKERKLNTRLEQINY